MKRSRSTPARSRKSMRDTTPDLANKSCAAPMSITASGLAAGGHRARHLHALYLQSLLQVYRIASPVGFALRGSGTR